MVPLAKKVVAIIYIENDNYIASSNHWRVTR